jgi:hypothetical protein
MIEEGEINLNKSVQRFDKIGCRTVTSPSKPNIMVTVWSAPWPVYPAKYFDNLIRSQLETIETHGNKKTKNTGGRAATTTRARQQRQRWWPVISSGVRLRACARFSVRFGSEASECTRLNHCNAKQSEQCDRWIGLVDGLAIQTG